MNSQFQVQGQLYPEIYETINQRFGLCARNTQIIFILLMKIVNNGEVILLKVLIVYLIAGIIEEERRITIDTALRKSTRVVKEKQKYERNKKDKLDGWCLLTKVTATNKSHRRRRRLK